MPYRPYQIDHSQFLTNFAILTTSLTTSLSALREAAIANEEENELFRIFVGEYADAPIDALVHRLNNDISAQIDCKQCGNCCRSLIINIEPVESEVLANHLNVSWSKFKEQFVEESQQGQLVINTIPCHFLKDNKCSVYEHRFIQCREFPHLQKNGFTKRLGGTLMHYGNCPIVYNVIEQLKAELSFKPE